MIPSYNCAGLLRETLRSVLVQDPGERQMQIEVIDEHNKMNANAGPYAGLERFAARERVVFPLQTIANLLGALREGDFSVRGRDHPGSPGIS